MKKHLSSLILLSAAAIWGFAFVAQKAATTVPPFTLIAARSIIASVFLIFIIMIFDKVHGERRLFVPHIGDDLLNYSGEIDPRYVAGKVNRREQPGKRLTSNVLRFHCYPLSTVITQ